ncbi:MAG: hypothetical protein JWM95_3614 [Gemmatimonadetes bacterium]|nr:hypothetical protein [Gemmatimonadota bacterium]
MQVTHLRQHQKKVHPATGKAAVAPRKHVNHGAEARSGELWARCPECRVPVKDAELFKHLLNCPGAEVRRAEWAAQQVTTAVIAATVEPDTRQ